MEIKKLSHIPISNDWVAECPGWLVKHFFVFPIHRYVLYGIIVGAEDFFRGLVPVIDARKNVKRKILQSSLCSTSVPGFFFFKETRQDAISLND